MRRSPGLYIVCSTYLTGILSTVFVTELPSASTVFIIGGTGVISAIAGCFFRAGWCYFGFLMFGIFTGFLHALSLQASWIPEKLQGVDLQVHGYIEGLPQTSGNLTRFRFIVSDHEERALQGKTIWLSWYQSAEVHTNEICHLTIRVKHPRGSFSDGAFDREAWAARENIQAVGYVKRGECLGERAHGLRAYRDKIRNAVRLWINNRASASSAALLNALLVGDKSQISSEQWRLFNLTGTTHLMVISGLHIGLMALLGYWLVQGLSLLGILPLSRIPAPRIAAITSLVLASLYALLAGFGVPVQRALVMSGLALAGPILGVKPRPTTLFLLALVVVLTLDPLAVTSPGFWYSFSAVAILLYGSCGRAELYRNAGGIKKWFKPQCLVFLMLCPMLMFNHQQVSLLSPLINLVAIPLVGLLVVPAAFMAVLSSVFVGSFSQGILCLLDEVLEYWLDTIHWLANSSWNLPLISGDWVSIGFTVLAVLVLYSPVALELRKLSLLFLLPWLLPVTKFPEEGEAKVAVLDVGQGLAVFVQTKSHALLYDTAGPSSGRFSPAEGIVLPYLHRHQVKYLDRIVISHGDSDHAGGLDIVHGRFPEAEIISGSKIGTFNGHISPCVSGQLWEWDNVIFEMLAGSDEGKSNDRSCVLKVSAGGRSLLLTGDIGKRGERKLLRRGMDITADVLLLPHHGSKYSGSMAFLNAVKPEEVLVSAGCKNRFGHPSQQALERVEAIGAQVSNTAESGTLSFLLSRDGGGVDSFRSRHQRYWWR